jgi:hypothetical protein
VNGASIGQPLVEDLSAALPDLVAETDRERHMDRMAPRYEIVVQAPAIRNSDREGACQT